MVNKFAHPVVGKLIEVTTQWPSNYIGNLGGNDTFHLTGVVAKNHKLCPTNSFSLIVNDVEIPLREISLDYVTDIRYVDGTQVEFATRADEPAVFTVTGSKGDTYYVTRQAGKYSCSCSGFQFRKICKQVTQIQESAQ
jgi:hypothetical protein